MQHKQDSLTLNFSSYLLEAWLTKVVRTTLCHYNTAFEPIFEAQNQHWGKRGSFICLFSFEECSDFTKCGYGCIVHCPSFL